MPRLPDPRFAPDCTIRFDGERIPARAGESVAVALLAAGRAVLARSAKYHRPRGAFCLAGSCHACLARVDGLPSRRTCQVPCRPGLQVETQNAVLGASRDLLAAIDRLYPRGLDHHHLMTWNGLANRAAVAFSRKLAGAGTLPAEVQPVPPSPADERFDAVVVGAGPAGLGAAAALARQGRRILLAEAERAAGGRLRCAFDLPGDPPLTWAPEVERRVRAAGGELALEACVAGAWRDREEHVLLVAEQDPLRPPRLVRTRRVVLATGSSALPPLFPRNDLPGILAERGLAHALAEDGLVPGARAIVLGTSPEGSALAQRLARAGMDVRAAEAAVAVRGASRVSELVLAGGERLACDTVVWAGERAPASQLGRAMGAPARWLGGAGGWALAIRPTGETAVPGLFAAGEVTGGMTAAEAALSGERAGEAAGA